MSLTTLTTIALAGIAATATPPRYELSVGDRLVYETQAESQGERNRFESTGSWTLWVLDANDDGSWRVLARAENERFSLRTGAPKSLWNRVWYGWFDLFPDGRYVHNDTLSAINPAAIFPRLPADDTDGEAGWTWEDPHFFMEYRGVVSTATDRAVSLRIERESITDRIYLTNRVSRAELDPNAGLMRRIETRTVKEWGSRNEEVVTMRLTERGQVDAPTRATLTAEAQRFFDVSRRYNRLTDEARTDLATLDARLEDAKAVLVDARAASGEPDFQARFDEMIEIHGPRTNYHRDRATRRAAVVGKPAPDWTLPDIDGTPYALADLRGKVVIIDFWYRACTWCVRSMPQLRRVVEELADEPVVFLGMNTDEDLDDARFVIDAMRLNYPSLQARGIPEQYQVRAFPTLFIIDQEGIVREVHLGYAADLGVSVVRQVRALLAGTPGSAG